MSLLIKNIQLDLEILYKCYCSSRKMLEKYRNYTVPILIDFEIIKDMSILDAKEYLSFDAYTDTGKNAYSYFLPVKKLDLNSIKKIVEMMEEKDLETIIVIYEDSFTHHVKPIIENLRLQSLKYIETFHYKELLFDPLEHELVPKHIICPASTKKEILKKYSITISQLPRIPSNDPICRRIGARLGQLIKIIRKGQTYNFHSDESITFENINFRIVVAKTN